LIPPGALRGGVACVIDVLRATSVMVHALAAGCKQILPCGEIDEAMKWKASLPSGSAILGGERGGLPIWGFDLGNSPADYMAPVCAGRTIVMTTTNGTRAILSSTDAEKVLVAAFFNLQATADELALEFLKSHGRPIHLVCAGTEGFISLEDTLLAGALTAKLKTSSSPIRLGNDEAQIALGLWLNAEAGFFRAKSESEPGAIAAGWMNEPLARFLAQGRGGQNVMRIGLGLDIDSVAEVDRFPLVARLQRDPLRIVTTDVSGDRPPVNLER
jgi:2-phosphosulfolactate phosphatase